MKSSVTIYTGGTNAGKSMKMYENLVDQAARCPGKQFYLIVPEQAGSGMEQQILSIVRERTGKNGVFNIDIIGFTRLAYRVFNEQGRTMKTVMEEYGKTILLRSVAARVKNELQLYRGSVDRQGFIDELKSLFSEFLLFDIHPEDLDAATEHIRDKDQQLGNKLKDVLTVYRAFRESEVFREEYMVAEELPAYLAGLLSEPGEIGCVDGAEFCFDGFTGFTAEQRKVLESLIPRASAMSFAVTLEPGEEKDPLFSQSREMLEQLLTLAPGAKVVELKREQDGRGEVLSALSKGVFRFPAKVYGGDRVEEALRIWKADTPLEEFRLAAEDIRRRVTAGEIRYRDAAILTPDMQGLAGYLDLVMTEYELPYFADQNRAFVNNPIIDAQLFILEMLDRDFTYESVFAFLKTGILDHAAEELGISPDGWEQLENFVLEHGIRGRKLWAKELGHFTGRRELSEMEALITEQLEELRGLLFSVLKPMMKFVGRKAYPVPDMIRGMQEIAEDPRLRLTERGEEAKEDLLEMGLPAEAEAYSGLQEKFLSVLEKTALILRDEEMSLHDLRETLLIGVGEIKVGVIPPTLDSVLIGDLERTRLGRVKVLYILNLNEGIYPRAKNRGGILSDQDRSDLEDMLRDLPGGKTLAPDETEKRFREQFSLYLAMGKPTECLTLCCSERTRTGGELERSYLLGRVLRMFPGLSAVHRERRTLSGAKRPDRMEYLDLLRRKKQNGLAEEERRDLRILSGAFSEEETEEAPEEDGTVLLPEELMEYMSELGKIRVSVSQLEKYAKCPYSFFLRYILDLKSRKLHEVGKVDVGLILHRILELTFRRVRDEHANDWEGITEEKLTELLRENVPRAIEEEKPSLLEQELRDGKTEVILKKLEELAENSIRVLKYQLSESRMLPEMLEGGFRAQFTADGPKGRKEEVTISGIVDRLDTFRDADEEKVYLRILDYKTGNKKLDLRDLRDGRNLQLTVYLKILTEIMKQGSGQVIPAGMYYFHVDQPVLKELSAGSEEEAAKKEMEKKLRLRGILNISPSEEGQETGEEGAEDPKHYLVELQEKTALDAERNLLAGKVLPIEYDRSKQLKKEFLATTEEMEGLGEYGLQKMKDLTDRIYSGRMEKHPTRMAGVPHNECEYCEGRAVCRFRSETMTENLVRKVADSGALMTELSETGRNERVQLRKLSLYEKQPEDEKKIRDALQELLEAETDDGSDDPA